MDIPTTLTEIAVEHVYPDLTEPQKREIDRRIDKYELNPQNTLIWEEVKASIKAEKFDQKFDDGENLTLFLDLSKTQHNLEF